MERARATRARTHVRTYIAFQYSLKHPNAMTQRDFFYNTVTAMATNAASYTSLEDLVKDAMTLTQLTDKMMPFDKNPITSKIDLAHLFDEFDWGKTGAPRKNVEEYIKEKTHFTSNRAMQTIINEALSKGIIKKNIKTRKYQPGISTK